MNDHSFSDPAFDDHMQHLYQSLYGPQESASDMWQRLAPLLKSGDEDMSQPTPANDYPSDRLASRAGTVVKDSSGSRRCSVAVGLALASILVAVSLLLFSSIHQRGSSPATSSPVNWLNHTYPNPCGSQSGQITVVNGVGEKAGFRLTIGTPLYGDLTHDGRSEAIVPYGCYGADFAGEHVFIFTAAPAYQTLLATLPSSQFAPGTIQNVTSERIFQGDLDLTGLGYSLNAPHCCPDEKILTVYHWDGHHFIITSSVAMVYHPSFST